MKNTRARRGITLIELVVALGIVVVLFASVVFGVGALTGAVLAPRLRGRWGFAACWLTAGAAHHTVMSTAVSVDVFRDFAEMAGAELLVIDNATTLKDFQKEVRWNSAYYRLAQGI